MGIIAKKISQKTFFSLLSVSALVVAFFIRLFLGGSSINLSKLESKAGGLFGQSDKIISTARADTPSWGESEGPGSSDGCG